MSVGKASLKANAPSTGHKHAIHNPVTKHSRKYGGGHHERWHPYQQPKRPFFSSIPSPETSPKPSERTMEASQPQTQQQSIAITTNPAQLPSPPPSDKSDQPESTSTKVPSLSGLTAKARLQSLLADPIRWSPATQKTLRTEEVSIAVNRSTATARSMPEDTNGTVKHASSGKRVVEPEVKPKQAGHRGPKSDSNHSATIQKSSRHPEQAAKDQVFKVLVQNGRISKTWSSWARGKKPRGLNNPGQYCYRRSVIQALLQTPAFISWLSGHQKSAECPPGNVRCIACGFKALLRAYYSGERLGPVTAQFDNIFNVLWPQVKGLKTRKHIYRLNNDQQDADEFVHGLLDAFCDAPRRTRPMPLEVRKALFEVTLSRTWQCLNRNCKGREHTNIQSERGLILDICKPRVDLNLKQYVQEYFRGDVVDDVTCDVCGLKHQRGRRRPIQLLAGPEILIIQLRRFHSERVKIKSRVGEITRLDLTELQPEQYQAQNKLEYKLKHIVMHSGSSIQSGHYQSICTSPAGMHLCDDEIVRPWTKLSNGMGHAYLLVYTKEEV